VDGPGRREFHFAAGSGIRQGGPELEPDNVMLRHSLVALTILSACTEGSVPPFVPKDQPAEVAGGPDLQVVASYTQPSVSEQEIHFSESSCAVVEKCVSAPGTRKLLSFAAAIGNFGKRDFVLGNPATNSDFEFSPCHGHYHLNGLLNYELVSVTGDTPPQVGNRVLVGRKQGFCLEDSEQQLSGQPWQFDCNNQGITVGWADIYSDNLECQWLDITGVPDGLYWLRLTVNPEKKFPESNYGNNEVVQLITIGETT
jgi:hypothetical protein